MILFITTAVKTSNPATHQMHFLYILVKKYAARRAKYILLLIPTVAKAGVTAERIWQQCSGMS
jgi:hypothetical protein